MVASMEQSAELEQLITKVAQGDRGAFKSLYEQSSAKLFGVCLRILKDRTQAEDALQEVYLKVWNKASSYDVNKARGMTWLTAMTRHHCIDTLRSSRSSEVSVEETEHFQDESPGPESATSAAIDAKRIQSCLSELESKHSQVVRRTYLNGWTYQQAADELKVPLNTVKTWIRRSLVALRECMNR